MIRIVSSENCMYCDMVKNLLKSLDIWFEVIDVSYDQKKLMKFIWITWMMSVPQIFNWKINKDNFIWGYLELKKLNDDWNLLKKLKNKELF